MHPKLANQRIERHHFGGVVEGNRDALARHQDVELVGIQDQIAGSPRLDRVPIGIWIEHSQPIDVDQPGVPLGTPADARALFSLQIDCDSQPIVDVGVAVDERRLRVQAS